MKTNAQMIRELKDFKAKTRGFLTGEEVKLIADTLHINEMNELALRNLRDFTVIYYARLFDGCEDDLEKALIVMDTRSAITGVIDSRLWRMGCEV